MARSSVDPITQRRRGVGLIAHDPQLGYGGYTLIAPHPGNGRVHLIDSGGEVVWEFILPWFAPYPDEAARRTGSGWLNTVFQTFRYSAEQPLWLARR